MSLPRADRNLFRYPINPCPSVAVVNGTLRLPAGCCRLAGHTFPDIRALRAETLAAPASLLLSFPAGWMPQFPIVAFTGFRHGFLDGGGRDRLWRRFRVPVFEQLIDDDGTIVACECEAHSGLHLEPSSGHTLSGGEIFRHGKPTGIAARDVTGVCGCGWVGTRVLEVGASIQSINANV